MRRAARATQRPLQRGGPDLVLALQRAAGNAATARRLQRNVGFEFEADGWRSWRRTQPVPADITALPPGQRVLPTNHYEPLKKKNLIHSGEHFKLEADELKANDRASRQMSDIEWVTEPFEESVEGLKLLAATMRAIALQAAQMDRLPNGRQEPKGTFIWWEELAGAGLNPPAGTMLDWGLRPTKVKMQATVGLRLDQVANLMASMGSAQPGESSRERKRRASGRDLMRRHQSGVVSDPAGMRYMGLAAAAAERACQEFGKTSPLPASAALKGLLSMVMLYIMLGDKLGAGVPYPKAIAAVMARTDFARLWSLVPRAERRALTPRRDCGPWLALVANATALRLDVPVLKDSRMLQSVTRELWLEQMTAGVDVLSKEGFDALAEALHPDIKSRAFLDMAKEGPSLESMGEMGDKTEGSGAYEEAIFELRAIPDMFVCAALPGIAMSLAKYVRGLNEGKRVNYKA